MSAPAPRPLHRRPGPWIWAVCALFFAGLGLGRWTATDRARLPPPAGDAGRDAARSPSSERAALDHGAWPGGDRRPALELLARVLEDPRLARSAAGSLLGGTTEAPACAELLRALRERAQRVLDGR